MKHFQLLVRLYDAKKNRVGEIIYSSQIFEKNIDHDFFNLVHSPRAMIKVLNEFLVEEREHADIIFIKAVDEWNVIVHSVYFKIEELRKGGKRR